VDHPPGAENWAAVGDAVRERLRELNMSKVRLARETGLSETTIRYIGRPDNGHHKSALVALSAALRWRRDHLTNILHGQPEKNTPVKTTVEATLERLLQIHLTPLENEITRLREITLAIDKKTDTLLPPNSSMTAYDLHEKGTIDGGNLRPAHDPRHGR
jgi:hypothetical protein